MKKIITSLVLFISTFIYSQVIFPELHPELLKGYKIKMDDFTPEQMNSPERMTKSYFENFYTDANCRKTYKGENSKTPIEELHGRVFTVEEVLVKKSMMSTTYTFTLTDGTEKLYHTYTPGLYRIRFTPVDFVPKPEYWDGYVSKFTSKLNGDTSLIAEMAKAFEISRYLDTSKSGFNLSKKVRFQMELNQPSPKGHGARLYMEDGKELFFPKAAVTQINDGNRTMVYFEDITPDQLDILSKVAIKDVDFLSGKTPYKYGEHFKNIMARFLAYKID